MGDYFARGASRSGVATPEGGASINSRASDVPSTPPPIRIRRLPSSNFAEQRTLNRIDENADESEGNRRRSMSAPQQRPNLDELTRNDLRRQRTSTQPTGLTPVREESSGTGHLSPMPPLPGTEEDDEDRPQTEPRSQTQRVGRLRAASSAAMNYIRRGSRSSVSPPPSRPQTQAEREYERDIVDLLDVIDPEVSTLTSLNNIQNSLFIPYLGRYVNRTPTYDLTRVPSIKNEIRTVEQQITQEQSTTGEKKPDEKDDGKPESSLTGDEVKAGGETSSLQPLDRSHSLSSVLREDKYAVLPHGVQLQGWTEEDVEELNDHVRHMLHSKRAGFQRGLKGFWRYYRTPLGFIVTTYAFIITFWGAAWVIFLIGWINVGDRRDYFIEICDQILTALLVVIGITLAPFRCIDTYHMGHIAYYHRLTWRLRKERELPALSDPNDLPEPDLEAAANQQDPDAVLTQKQLKIFRHHQAKFAQAHTYYRPHETFTHRAFPLWCLITIVALLDAHSCFQIALGGTTWGIYYKKRGHILTTVILAFSLTCNITGGIMVSVGDKLTRKKEIKEQLYRQALTLDAMKEMHKKKGLQVPAKVQLLDKPPVEKKKDPWYLRPKDKVKHIASTYIH